MAGFIGTGSARIDSLVPAILLCDAKHRELGATRPQDRLKMESMFGMVGAERANQFGCKDLACLGLRDSLPAT